MESGTIEIRKTARFFTLGELGEHTTDVWVVLHGYGHLANYFIRSFEPMANERHVVIAPEGMHRFYKEGFSGRVGASWMTKEARLDDIKDYVRFLDQLVDEVVKPNCPKARVHVIGFSQGGATASRWVNQGHTKFTSLTLWASVFPPDMDFEITAKRWEQLVVSLVLGDQDEFISTEQLDAHVAEMNGLGLTFTITGFSGKHEVDPGALVALRDRLSTN